MTTWTPATQQSETWTEENEPTRIFSRDVFSHASYSGKFVFSMGKRGGVWDKLVKQIEGWVNL